jgi:trimeric autotransporter adhesin
MQGFSTPRTYPGWIYRSGFQTYNNTPIPEAQMKHFHFSAYMIFLLTSISFAQDIESKLSGNTAAQGFTVKSNSGTNLFTIRGDGKVGIGTLSPDALLHLAGQIKITGGAPGLGKVLTSDANGLATWTAPSGGGTLDQAYDYSGAGAGRTITADAGALKVQGVDGLLVTGTYGSGTIPATGAGTRMMFYPKKSAFRAGYVDGTQWDDANIGHYSTAMGYGTTASGDLSTAMGYGTTVSGDVSTAMGEGTTASGNSSTAMGW